MSGVGPGSDRFAEVLRLAYVEGLGVRAIARKTALARKTVRRILGRSRALPALAPKTPRPSLIDPYRDELRRLLGDEPELRTPSVLERLRPLGYKGGVSILRDAVRSLRPKDRPSGAFLTLDFAPGAAVQVDWADFGFALPGCPRRVSAFVMAMCYSRQLYLEFTLSQAMGSFLRCMERGLAFFGGRTLMDIFDNMKTVVILRTPQLTVFNPRFLEYAAARGFAVKACNVGKGNEKGRVERPIGFVRSRFWPGRHFSDLFDLNRQASAWRDDFANNREHEVTGKIPSLVFANEERGSLKPLGTASFNTDDVTADAGVTKTFRVSFDRNRYSVPWRLVGQQVVVRADDHAVSVWLGPKQVAMHRRSWGVGEDIKLAEHEEGLLRLKPRAAAAALPPGLLALGDLGGRYFRLLAASSRSIRRETERLVWLCELYGESATASAVEEVMLTGHVGADYVEYVLKHRRGLTPSPAPLRLGNPELDQISFQEPDLSRYDRPHRTLDPGPVPRALLEPPKDKEPDDDEK